MIREKVVWAYLKPSFLNICNKCIDYMLVYTKIKLSEERQSTILKLYLVFYLRFFVDIVGRIQIVGGKLCGLKKH